MKILVKPFLIAAIVLIGAAVTEVKAQKVAHINATELLDAMPDKAQMAASIQAFQKKLEQKLITMQTELQQKVTTYQQQEGLMTEAIKQSNVKDIQDLEVRIQEFQVLANQELQLEENKIMKPVIEKIRKAINDVAKEKGFDYVLDTGAGGVLYFEGGTDILPDVKKKLGVL